MARYLPARWPVLLILLLVGCAGFTDSGRVNAAPSQSWFGAIYFGDLYQDYYDHQWKQRTVFNLTVGLPVDLHDRAFVSDTSIGFSASATVATGHLPPGLSLDNNGHIVGAPTEAGDYSCTIQFSQITYGGEQFPDQTVTVRIVTTGN